MQPRPKRSFNDMMLGKHKLVSPFRETELRQTFLREHFILSIFSVLCMFSWSEGLNSSLSGTVFFMHLFRFQLQSSQNSLKTDFPFICVIKDPVYCIWPDAHKARKPESQLKLQRIRNNKFDSYMIQSSRVD